MNDREALGLDLTQVPILGTIVAGVQGQLTGAKQRLIQRVADFAKLQGDLSSLNLTLTNLARIKGARLTLQQSSKIAGARAVVDAGMALWRTTDERLNTLLTALREHERGNVAVDARWLITEVPAVTAQMAASHTAVSRARAAVAGAISAANLTPQEKAELGAVPRGSMANAGILTLVALIGIGGALLLKPRKRSR